MKKIFIVDENGNVVLSTKSEKKAIGWMLFNAVWDGESETGALPDGPLLRCIRQLTYDSFLTEKRQKREGILIGSLSFYVR